MRMENSLQISRTNSENNSQPLGCQKLLKYVMIKDNVVNYEMNEIDSVVNIFFDKQDKRKGAIKW